jgi:hypothetical protein
MRFVVSFFKSLPLILLTACTSIPLSSMLSLSRIDFGTTDVAALRIAVELPDVIDAREGGVHMEVEYVVGEAKDKMVFRLKEDVAQEGLRGLLPNPVDGRHVKSYRLRDEDIRTLNRIRTDVLARKQQGDKGSLGFGVSAKEFCRRESLENKTLEVTTFVATSETKGFVVLLKDYDLNQDATIKTSLANIPPCAT